MWIVKIFGGPNKKSFEISVVRKENKHGQNSYGWFDKDKLLISHNGGPCDWPVIPLVWDKLVQVAEEVAKELNRIEPIEIEVAHVHPKQLK